MGYKLFGINNKSYGSYDIIENNYELQNVMNVLGWIPFLGFIVGIIRIGDDIVICVNDENSNKPKNKKYYIKSVIRGIVETCCLGFIFVIPDLAVTMIRK